MAKAKGKKRKSAEPIKAPVTVLVVEDDWAQRKAICRLLEGDNFLSYRVSKISEAENLKEATELIKSNTFSLAVIDCHFPKSPGHKPKDNGLKLCREMRDRNHACPVIIVTGEALTAEDEARCLYGGANDYLRKPFNDSVLLSRLESLLRQHEGSGNAELQIGPWLFCPSKNLLVRGSVREHLTSKEARLLLMLYKERGLILARPKVKREIWNHDAAIQSHTLETHIYRLRQKMENDPRNPRLIETCERGYRLNISQPS
ncbi:MAG: response regulator transcription factor [Rhodobacteraceae bacterium]|nr:response regulator transcription factor [Paracoccaceae bacterium]